MSDHRYAQIVEGAGSRLFLHDLFDQDRKIEAAEHNYKSGSIISYRLGADNELITALVAQPDSANAVLWFALAEHGLDPSFSRDVQEELKSVLAEQGIDDDSLVDLTHLPFVTIDNTDSRDLDQAMHIEAGASGFTVWYALADAAYYVRPGSEMFDRALRFGASYYLPGFSVPMLPRELSEGLVSLNEGCARRSVVFITALDKHGVVCETSVVRARIISASKLSYGGVENYYLNGATSDLSNRAFTPTLDALRDVGLLRIARARERDVVTYDRSGIEVEIDSDGIKFLLSTTDRLAVESYNEQVSLLCNSEGARLLKEAGVSPLMQAIFRVHEAPEAERLRKFNRLLKGLVKARNLSPVVWTWRWRDGVYGTRESLADYLERLRNEGVDAGLLDSVSQHARRLSPASQFTAEPGPHHSLKLDSYARFSSPMREIAGIFTHREILQHFKLSDAGDEDVDDSLLREQVIKSANRSREIQKKLNKAMLKGAIDEMFSDQLKLTFSDRKTWSGTIMSLRSTRINVRLDEPMINVKIYLRQLAKVTEANYHLDESAAYIVDVASSEMVYSIGQKITLRVQGYQESSGKWLLLPE